MRNSYKLVPLAIALTVFSLKSVFFEIDIRGNNPKKISIVDIAIDEHTYRHNEDWL